MVEGLMLGSVVGSVIAVCRQLLSEKRWKDKAQLIETKPRFGDALEMDAQYRDCRLQSRLALVLAIVALIACVVGWR